MPQIPSYAEWKKKTDAGTFVSRSSELELVDKALLKFEKERGGQSLIELWRAWNGWKRTKPDWRLSSRNKNHVLDDFDQAITERLGPMGDSALSPQEKTAYLHIETARREAFRQLFAGKEVKFKKNESRVEAKNAVQELGKVAKGVIGAVPKGPPSSGGSGAAGSVVKAIDSMIGDFFDEAGSAVVKPILMEAFGTDVVAAMVPIVGHLVGAAQVLVSWGAAGKKYYDEVTFKDHRAFIGGAGTDAAQAFKGVERLLDAATRSALITAGTKTASFTARSLLALADGGAISGPVMGAAEAVAKVSQRLYELGAEYKQTKKANLLLRDPTKLDFRLVQAYPLLGCYMLTCCNTSDVVNMSRVQFGGKLWLEDVDYMVKKHVVPVRMKARTFIDASIFHVPGLTPRVASGKMDEAAKVKQLVIGR